MFYEFRQYTLFPGKRAEWVKYMESVVIPFQVAKGMVVLGSFVDEQDENVYYWIRRFKNEKERERLYKKVYESSAWKNEIWPACRRTARPQENRGQTDRADPEVGCSVDINPVRRHHCLPEEALGIASNALLRYATPVESPARGAEITNRNNWSEQSDAALE